MNQYIPDTFFNGHISVKQDRHGYRFSIDAVLLADFIRIKPRDCVVDLGTGCGILPLILAVRNPEAAFTGIEIQPRLAGLAAGNVQQNRLDHRIRIRTIDMKNLTPADVAGPVDVVISNPPYRKIDSGRINPDSQRAVARHEIKIKLMELLEVAAGLLRTAGRFFTIYPADRAIDLLSGMRHVGIEPKRVRTIHSVDGAEAKLILAEGSKGGGRGVQVMNPLIIYRDPDNYTDEVERMFAP